VVRKLIFCTPLLLATGVILLVVLGPMFSKAQQTQEKTRLLDFTVRPVGTQSRYSGRFLLRETNEPLVDGYVYLIDPQTREHKAEARTDATGYFELVADAPDLSVMISTSPVQTREGKATEVPWLDSVMKTMPTWFPKERYGYKDLILNPQAEIVLKQKDAILKLPRSLTFSEAAGISASSFEHFNPKRQSRYCQRLSCGIRSGVWARST
jgi:hypothetical protein